MWIDIHFSTSKNVLWHFRFEVVRQMKFVNTHTRTPSESVACSALSPLSSSLHIIIMRYLRCIFVTTLNFVISVANSICLTSSILIVNRPCKGSKPIPDQLSNLAYMGFRYDHGKTSPCTNIQIISKLILFIKIWATTKLLWILSEYSLRLILVI